MLALFPTFIRIIAGRLGYSIVVTIPTNKVGAFIQSPLESVLSFVFLADILLLIILVLFIEATSSAFVISRRDFSTLLLHFARMPMIITTLAMTIAFFATVFWATRIWMVVPALPLSETSSRILFLLVFAAMALSCGISIHAMRGSMTSHTPLTP